MQRFRSEKGASAVEFALVLPVLLSLIMGIMEFGNYYRVQVSLTAAAREGVRVMAIKNDPAAARTAVRNALVLNPAPTDSQISVSPTSCGNGQTATVQINYTLTAMTGFFGKSFNLQGQGAMQCGG